ncbi:MAG: DUF4147 domain-containing protein [Anaerolineales bacterium]|nr:DUF4147 domain-containing protein [Anaerolineales bacterium]
MTGWGPKFDQHRAHLSAIRAAALAAVDPAAAVRAHLAPADWEGAANVYLVGAGKAGVPMALAAAALLGPRLTAGVVVAPRAPGPDIAVPPTLSFVEGGHPQPTTGSLAGGRAVAALLTRAAPGDLVVVVISGGGSALLELPRPGVSLDDLRQTNRALLRSGAAIHEINLIRAQLSQLKGGGLARLAHPARTLALILSDVVGNPLASIASGPTVVDAPPEATAALAVVERYGLRDQLPAGALYYLTHGTGPLPGEAPRVENRLVGSNRQAGEAAAAAARELGFAAEWLGDDWQGEARDLGRRLAELACRAPGPSPLRRRAAPLAADQRPRCLVAGGESTVTVRGAGRGGRNQEAALGAARVIDSLPNIAIAAIATDGVDGPTDAAGALVTGDTLRRARALGLDVARALAENDSYPCLEALGALLFTGPTGTNVGDLLVGLVY